MVRCTNVRTTLALARTTGSGRCFGSTQIFQLSSHLGGPFSSEVQSGGNDMGYAVTRGSRRVLELLVELYRATF